MVKTDRFLPIILIASVVYAVPATVGICRNPDIISPDVVSYVQNARMVAEGRFSESVSGYWSPLEGWMMAGLIRGGLDPLHAKRVTSLLAGSMLVVGAGLFSRRLGPMHPWWRAGMLCSLSASAAYGSIRSISPDLLMAGILLFYFHLITSPSVLEHKGRLFACGILGGLAYLAKSYALPFFALHFVVSIVLLTVQDRAAGHGNSSHSRSVLTQVVVGGLIGGAGLTMVAGPWIYALHAKYGTWTMSTAGAYNRDIVRPGRLTFNDNDLGLLPRSIPHVGLWDPEPGRISIWETPERLPHSNWSIRENLRYQIRLTLANLKLSRYVISNIDPAGLSLSALMLSPFLFLMITDRFKARLLLWFPMTGLLYMSGYLLIFSDDRYLEPVFVPLCCLLAFSLAEHLLSVPKEDGVLNSAGSPPTMRWTWIALVAMVAFFSVERATRAAALILRPAETPYRAIAQELADLGIEGPLASTNPIGLYVAYHMRQPFLRTPRSQDWRGAEAELHDHGARAFLVFADAAPAFAKEQPLSWRLATEINGGPATGMIRVYRP